MIIKATYRFNYDSYWCPQGCDTNFVKETYSNRYAGLSGRERGGGGELYYSLCHIPISVPNKCTCINNINIDTESHDNIRILAQHF